MKMAVCWLRLLPFNGKPINRFRDIWKSLDSHWRFLPLNNLSIVLEIYFIGRYTYVLNIIDLLY